MNDSGLCMLDDEPGSWQGEYALAGYDSHIIISSTTGIGDVNIKLIDGSVIYAECKKGKNDKRGPEYPLMSKAIGQLMTGGGFTEGVIPMVAVPYTDKSRELAERWSALTQIKNLGIRFALVEEIGMVDLF